MGSDWTSARITAALLVCALVVLGYALSRPGIDFLHPHCVHHDGLVVVRQAELFRSGAVAPDQDRNYVAYPHLMPRLLALLPAAADGVEGAHDLEHELERANAPWVQARLASLLLSLLAIPATYWLARRFLERPAALLATALLATSLIHVHFSILSQPHGAAASFCLLAVLAALRLRRRGRAVDYVMGGVAAGVAVGFLHTGLAVVPALVLAHGLRASDASDAGGAGGTGGTRTIWLFVALAIVAASVRWLYPWFFTRPPVFDRTLPGELPVETHGQFPLPFAGRGLREIVLSLWSYEPLLLALGLVGTGFLLARLGTLADLVRTPRGRDLAVVLAHALPYFVVLALYDGTLERFLMPLLPYFACLGAFGVSRVLACLRAGAPGKPVSAFANVLAFASLALPLSIATALCRARSAPDTLEQAADWIAGNVVSETERIVVVPYVDLPLTHSDEALAENAKRPWTSIWVRHQMRQPPPSRGKPRHTILLMPGEFPQSRQLLGSDPELYFDTWRADYVVIRVEDFEFPLAPARRALLDHAEAVLRISPLAEDDGREHELLFRDNREDVRKPYWLEILESRCMGPTVEIYRWRRAAAEQDR